MSQPMGLEPTLRRETADKLRERYKWLQSFSDEELSEICYCTPDEIMRGDEVYFDISQPERGIIQGEEGMRVPEGSCYVPRSEVRRDLWDKLVEPYV